MDIDRFITDGRKARPTLEKNLEIIGSIEGAVSDHSKIESRTVQPDEGSRCEKQRRPEVVEARRWAFLPVENELGVWLAGAVAPWATEENIEKLRRLSLSGDWRPKGGSYFLIAAQAVPVPGFPIRARVASGIQVSLTTVGPANPIPDPLEDMSELGLVATALQMTNAKLDEALAWIRPQMEAERQRQYEEALAVLTD